MSYKEYIIEKIQSEIHNNYQNIDFNVNALSDAVHMTRSTLYRNSKKLFRKSPHIMLEEYRLNKAIEYLHNRNLRIKEIAHSIGFSDDRYFSLKFKKKFGVSPTLYRDNVLR